ncbi:hypothetical protein PSEMO_46570 [Pseudomonas putida]|uniref:Uncharacterized protein n=1 Tax=Pseudomonas putida TaxID=303 RepID=A0A1Q9QYL5_PSEPU|nr:hypothetical protein PSEMO_46570 [Pseudomonas putida]
MSCLICAGRAESVECSPGWEERRCPQCGCYRMSQSLVLLMMNEGQIFDSPKMRAWLEVSRSQVPVPSIDLKQAIIVQ